MRWLILSNIAFASSSEGNATTTSVEAGQLSSDELASTTESPSTRMCAQQDRLVMSPDCVATTIGPLTTKDRGSRSAPVALLAVAFEGAEQRLVLGTPPVRLAGLPRLAGLTRMALALRPLPRHGRVPPTRS